MKKRKDGRYMKMITIDGKRHAFYGKTQSEVYQNIREHESKKEIGRTFSEVADEWQEAHEKKVVYSTMAAYYPATRRAKEYFGDMPLKEITPKMVNTFILSFCQSDPSKKTAYHQLTVVSMILKNGIISGDIDSNPAQYVKLPNGLSKINRELPSDEDLETIKNSLEVPFGKFAYMILYTGIRRGEALALTYEDIDFDKLTICINKSLAYNKAVPYLKTPKTKSGERSIPLLDPLKILLKNSDKRSGLIFESSQGGFMPDAQYQRHWEKYQRLTGVSCTAHQLRHAFATIIFEAGVSSKDAQHLLGHADISTTNNIYTHIREQKQKDTAQKINAYIK